MFHILSHVTTCLSPLFSYKRILILTVLNVGSDNVSKTETSPKIQMPPHGHGDKKQNNSENCPKHNNEQTIGRYD